MSLCYVYLICVPLYVMEVKTDLLIDWSFAVCIEFEYLEIFDVVFMPPVGHLQYCYCIVVARMQELWIFFLQEMPDKKDSTTSLQQCKTCCMQ